MLERMAKMGAFGAQARDTRRFDRRYSQRSGSWLGGTCFAHTLSAASCQAVPSMVFLVPRMNLGQ
jgi:hypothetical protein